MEQLAREFGEDEQVWTVVGLCHDLDDQETAADRSQHGLLTAPWMAVGLPPDALRAIEAHDHRTGIRSNTRLADMLKLADALAIADTMLGRGGIALLETPGAEEALRVSLASRPYLADILIEKTHKHGLGPSLLAAICRAAPGQ